jgi:hypothetical protein
MSEVNYVLYIFLKKFCTFSGIIGIEPEYWDFSKNSANFGQKPFLNFKIHSNHLFRYFAGTSEISRKPIISATTGKKSLPRKKTLIHKLVYIFLFYSIGG